MSQKRDLKQKKRAETTQNLEVIDIHDRETRKQALIPILGKHIPR